MQSYLEITGYGFRKRLCENVTIWFLDKFLPRHQLDIQIVHRGLKREGVLGYCDFTDDYKRPRSFLIELDTYMEDEIYIKTLLHELVHLRQWVNGSLKMKRSKMYYGTCKIENYDYIDQPHEIEARQQESFLYLQYLLDVGVPVRHVAHYFPNRLTQAV
jgi:hypothetical protein